VKNVIGLNLTPEPAPTGEIWHLNPNSSGFINEFLLGVFGVFRFFSGFRFFGVSGAPAGEK
jgi:hypothetical protein